MRRATDTLLRQWSMLRLIPRAPKAIGTREIHNHLAEQGFAVELRTIQRDLDRLSLIFPLSGEAEGKALRWSWMAGAAPLDIPSMDPPTALAFQLAAVYLAPLLPPATLHHLDPHFQRAQVVLAATRGTHFSLWPDKVCAIVRGPVLQAPAIVPSVQETVYQALLTDRQLVVAYRRKAADRPKTYPVHPLGLVFRDGVVYLVCTAKSYADIRHLALHRMTSAMLRDEPARRPEGFSLSRYVKDEQFFSYPLQGRPIHAELLFERDAALHLAERPLSPDQRLIPQKDGRVLLRATVRDTLELRWWVQGFGDQVEVVAPASWRAKFADMVHRLANRYGNRPQNNKTARRKSA
jgi:predicted DNA-binding transcriptional regulator YafY